MSLTVEKAARQDVMFAKKVGFPSHLTAVSVTIFCLIFTCKSHHSSQQHKLILRFVRVGFVSIIHLVILIKMSMQALIITTTVQQYIGLNECYVFSVKNRMNGIYKLFIFYQDHNHVSYSIKNTHNVYPLE